MALVASLGKPLALAATPYLVKIVIDRVLRQEETGLLPWIIIGYFGFSALRGISSFVVEYLGTWVGGRVVLKLRSDLYQNLQRLSLSFYDQHRVGDLVSRLTGDLSTVERLFVNGLSNVLSNMLTIVFSLAMMFYLSWHLALVALLTTPVMFVVSILYLRRIRVAARRVRAKVGDVAAQADEGLADIALVKSFSREDFEQDRFDAEAGSSFRATIQAIKLKASLSPVMDLLFTVGLVAVIIMGTFEHSSGVLTIGSLVAVLLYLRALYSPVRSLSNRAATVQSALAGAERVFALLDLDTSTHDQTGSIMLSRPSGHIKFDRVTFGYNGGPPILEDFSLEVQPGETIALVGQSGVGKTTVVNLLLRLYRPQLGRILLDGIDIDTAEPRSLRRLIAVVPQDPRLLTGSILENIRYGRPDAPDKMVDLAARVAFDEKFIRQFPDGYETHVGQHGATLSPGQRQRIAIARALLRDAPILILDDATAALDPPAEEAVQAAFEILQQGRTVIVIAHRLSTIRRADRIVVLDCGLVVGSGTHDQLLINCEAYHRLYAREGTLI